MNSVAKRKKLPLEKKILIALYGVPILLTLKLLNHLGEMFMGKPVYDWGGILQWVLVSF